MQKKRRNRASISAVAAGFFVFTVSASAFGLSDEDYVYLETQHVARSKAPVLDLSPLERTRLHNVINDQRTTSDPAARDEAVREILVEFLSHQLWEKAHPGKLWDAPNQ